jgi:hypothetical protein
MTNPTNTPPPQFAEPSPTIDGVILNQADYEVLYRNALSVVIKLHKLFYNIPKDRKVRVKFILEE